VQARARQVPVRLLCQTVLATVPLALVLLRAARSGPLAGALAVLGLALGPVRVLMTAA